MPDAGQSRQEVVFETTAALCVEEPAIALDRRAVLALRQLPGVLEAHVDRHGTWAMVTFDPEVTTISSLTGALAVHGLRAERMRSLIPPDEPASDAPTPFD